METLLLPPGTLTLQRCVGSENSLCDRQRQIVPPGGDSPLQKAARPSGAQKRQTVAVVKAPGPRDVTCSPVEYDFRGHLCSLVERIENVLEDGGGLDLIDGLPGELLKAIEVGNLDEMTCFGGEHGQDT